MSAAKHTPGPLTVTVENKWPFRIVTRDAACLLCFAVDMPCVSTRHQSAEEAIAGKDMPPSWEAAKHNARAIADEVLRAAAPDLLEALQNMHQVLQEAMSTGGWVPTPVQASFRDAWIDMTAAIAKATGEQQ